MQKPVNWIIVVVVGMAVGAAIGGCDDSVAEDPATPAAAVSIMAYEQEILDWRATRLQKLLAPTGYLNQIGLYWLDEGSTTFGSDSANDIVLPANSAANIGVFELTGGSVNMTVTDGVQASYEGQTQSSLLLRKDTDTSGPPMVINHASFAWSLIERAGRLAIRFRDYEHPYLKTFGPIPYYAIDPDLRVDAMLTRYDEPRVAHVGTVIEGLPYNPQTPGTVAFEIDGVTYDLEAYLSGDRLFFVFGDLTSRGETYGAGRFLYAEMPGDDGHTVLDFNKAYSPPCAFNDFSTCPVASPRNRLKIRVAAGEKYDSALHYSGAT